MSNKEPKSILLTDLLLTVWESSTDENVKWETIIADAQTKEVLVRVHAASEEKAIGDAGYKLYTGFFSNKKFEQVEKSSIGSKKKNDD